VKIEDVFAIPPKPKRRGLDGAPSFFSARTACAGVCQRLSGANFNRGTVDGQLVPEYVERSQFNRDSPQYPAHDDDWEREDCENDDLRFLHGKILHGMGIRLVM